MNGGIVEKPDIKKLNCAQAKECNYFFPGMTNQQLAMAI